METLIKHVLELQAELERLHITHAAKELNAVTYAQLHISISNALIKAQRDLINMIIESEAA